MRRLLRSIAICSLVAGAASAFGATEVAQLPWAVANVIDEPPTIDGKLDDPVWTPVPQLRIVQTMAGGTASRFAAGWVNRTGDKLFIAVRCEFAEGSKLKVDQTQRDSEVWTDESIEVFIDPGVSLRKYYHFVLSAANVQLDEAGDKAGSPPFDASWNAEWQSATSTEEKAWSAELAIPLSALGLKAGAQLIGLNVCRNDRTANETVCWSPTITGFHEPVRFGLMSLPAQSEPPRVAFNAKLPRQVGLGRGTLALTLNSPLDRLPRTDCVVIAGNELGRSETHAPIGLLAEGATVNVEAPYELSKPGDNAIVVAVRGKGGEVLAATKLVVSLPAARTTEARGYRVPGGESLGVWWAESMYKIHRDDPAPTAESPEVRLSAAGREYEAAQIVLRPPQGADVTLSVSDLKGPGGAIAADNLRLFEVAYVPVWRPTDSFGWVGDWPDPLPPLEGALHCKRGENQPVWLLAYVPPDTPPGRYRGTVTASANGESVSIPLSLTVYGFSLTPETHTKTAYGCGPYFDFQNVKDEAQQEEVFDLYMQSCRDHRLAPYSPMARHPIRIETIAPMQRFVAGRLGIEFEKGERLWKLHWNGKEIASQRTSMTHFGGEGVGWQGTGLGWPYLQTIESVTEVSRTDDMRVLEVVGAHLDSAVAGRSFRLTFRFYVPSGDDWFGLRLVKMESTDPEEIEVRSYFNIPQTVFKAGEIANGPGFAAWSGEGLGFGMLCLDGQVGGLQIAQDGQSVTVNSEVPAFRTKGGETHDGWGPLVVYFVTEDTSSAALAARAGDLSKRINPADPAAYKVVAKAETSEERRDGYSFTHDFRDFDQAATRYLDEFWFNAFNEPALPGSIAGEPRFTPEYKRLHKLMYGPVIEHLREKGWLDKAYAYWYDEPDEQAYPFVREGMELLKEDCPGLTRLLTEQPEEPLFGAVNLWVPVLSMYRPEACQARQTAGDDVWWYVCCGPGHPYPNNFIDHPGINHRIRFWMMEKYGVEGSLYWATTYLGAKTDKTPKNPWEDGMSYTPDGGYWGNGDGMLLYPACRKPGDTPVVKGPVASIRWELLRDGLEDREYFWTLKQEVARLEALRADQPALRGRTGKALAQAESALKLPDGLAESLVVYTKDPQDLLRARETLAKAIEACRKVQ